MGQQEGEGGRQSQAPNMPSNLLLFSAIIATGEWVVNHATIATVLTT